ncbi:hypothetical protein [Nocardioides sp. TF02-7]|uniref:hypothetical protein n=1 Tax=Nocardioides sp. TF02-7 TaxID=2917724 RepID=UPI001F057E12|nr:hypothetical protein [Nocardioides sp. TF02-7]UMG93319.1 hypothetical protein MF408_03300 [Nocardioides sp. TF02-7]
MAALGALTAALLLPAAAHADGLSNPGGGGYRVSVTAVVSGGEGDPVSGGSISLSVPPVCWWEPVDGDSIFAGWKSVDPSDAEEFDEWYKDHIRKYTSTFVPARLFLPTVADFKDAMRRHQAGEPVQWYHLGQADGVNCADEGFARNGGQLPPDWEQDGSRTAPISYIAVTGQPEPPMVEVEDVVETLWDEAVQGLGAPELARNPEIAEAGQATLVNIPTWFWVENQQEALAEDGEIHLEVHIPGTPVQATLDAATTGMEVSAPSAGARTCTVEQAKTAWERGGSDESACTLAFREPNPAAWPVTASITWTGSWQGTDHNGAQGGELETQTHGSTVDVPVVEAGALVTGIE